MLNLLFEAVPAERGAILLLEGDAAGAGGQGLAQPPGQADRRRSAAPSRARCSKTGVAADPEHPGGRRPSRPGQHPLHRHPLRHVRAALVHRAAERAQDAVIGLVYLDSLLGSSQTFTEEDLRIVTALANVAAAKIENVRLLEESLEKRRLEEDMRVAAEIQRGLLPDAAPGGARLRPRRRRTSPAATVGGDYYDFALRRAATCCSPWATSRARARAPRCS